MIARAVVVGIECERGVAVQCGERLHGRLLRRFHCGHFGLYVHQVHFYLVHFKGSRSAVFELLCEQGEEFFGILAPEVEQRFHFFQVYEVEAKVLGAEQYVSACGRVLQVKRFALQFARLAACGVNCGEVESLRYNKLRTCHSACAPAKERAVFNRRVFKVVLRLDFGRGGFVVLAQGLQFLVVLLNAFEYVAYALRARPGGGKCEQREQYYDSLFHCGLFVGVSCFMMFFLFISS